MLRKVSEDVTEQPDPHIDDGLVSIYFDSPKLGIQ